MSDRTKPSLIVMGSGAGGTARFLCEAVASGGLPLRIGALVTDNPRSGLVRLAEEAALPLFILPFPAAAASSFAGKRLSGGGAAPAAPSVPASSAPSSGRFSAAPASAALASAALASAALASSESADAREADWAGLVSAAERKPSRKQSAPVPESVPSAVPPPLPESVPDSVLKSAPKTAEEWDGALLKILQKQRPDWILLAGFLRKIGPQTLAVFQNKILNTHPSLLPKFGGKGMHGLNVYRAVCRSGVKETGVSIHIVTQDYDAGSVLVQEKTAVWTSDTPETLQDRVKLLEKALLKKFLGRLALGEIFLPRSQKDRLILFLKGAVLGGASVLPGVSGGTAAFLLNIYEKLVLEISKIRLFAALFKKRLKPLDFGFWIPLLLGAAVSVFAFSFLAVFVIQEAPRLFKALVFCLILGSLYFPLKNIRKSAGNILAAFAAAFLTAAAFYFFPGGGAGFGFGDSAGGSSGGSSENSAVRPFFSSALWFFPAGLMAGPALVLPGLSGAYILILSGFYEAVLEAVKGLSMAPLFFFAAGAAGGGILTARLMNRLLNRHFEKTSAVIVGLIAGSLVYLARL